MASVATSTITVDLASTSTYPVEGAVGRIYEVAINGQGYMLADSPDGPNQYERATVSLQPERLATSETPFSEAIERYTIEATSSFHGGAGQRFVNREDATGTAFLSSEGFDPFSERGELSVLNATEQIRSLTYITPRIALVGNTIYVQDGDDTLEYSSDGASWTTLGSITDTAGPVVMSDLTSDGNQWYAATGNSIIRGTTSNPGADWSTEDAVYVEWAAGRIMAAIKGATSSTPNVLKSILDSGAVEATHLTLPDEQEIVLGNVASGHFYFGAQAGSHGQVWAWKLGLTQAGGAFYSPFVAWEMPHGLIPIAVYGEGATVYVKAYKASEGAQGTASIYRCLVADDGSLTPILIEDSLETVTALDPATGQFAATENVVLFTWSDLSASETGLGAIDMASGGYAKWLSADGVTGDVTDVVYWRGKEVFTVASVGVYVRDLDVYRTDAQWTSSLVDGASAIDKVWDDVTLVTDPLPASTTLEVFYSIDGGGSYSSLGTMTTDGRTSRTFALGVEAPSLSLRLSATTTDSSLQPVVQSVQARYHPLGLADTVLVLPIDCGDILSGLNGAPLPENGPGAGVLRARTLESLTQTRVVVQDIDWPTVGATETFEVLSTQTTAQGSVVRGTKVWRKIVTLTMRKEGA